MEYNIISSDKLLSSERWDPSFFICNDKELKSKYDLMSIGEVVTERRSFIEPRNYLKHVFNYIGLENISQNTRVLNGFSPKKGIEIKSRSKIFRNGDLLYGRLRPNLNKVLLIDDSLNEGICSSEIFVLSPKANLINAVYFSEILTSSWVLNEIDRLAGGATLPRVNINDFLNIKIPIPDIETQNLIAIFISNSRDVWLEHSCKYFQMPPAMKQSISDFIAGENNLELDLHFSALNKWENPLPDLELKSR